MKSCVYRRLLGFMANLATPSDFAKGNWEPKNRLLRRTGMRIGRHVAIGPDFQWIRGMEEHVDVDDHVAVGHNAHFWCFNTIRVGKFTMIAADVALTNGWHDTKSMEPDSGQLSIGRGCWIGMGARIVGNITIGDNAIIGAGSLVLKSVAPATIVAGIPAKKIRDRELASSMAFFNGIRYSPITFETTD